ncbi:MAG: type II toxin-antitoxin system RelE/ParE family toxin [Nanoarchaeota archaeon]|nr:type II toxin-antitoxin system RelE/ParE family toxin [Nanoarchaeota archaeon]
MYELIIDNKAIEFLEKLPKINAQRIFKKIQQTKENPHRYFIRLTNRNEYKLRVGDYRIIGDIEDNKLKILIIHIGHRKNVYKK